MSLHSSTVAVKALPTCSITGGDFFCPASINNIYNATVGMTAYIWTISGNGSINGTSSGSTVNVAAGPNHANPFILGLTVTNGNGCSSTCQKTVTVEKTPPIFTKPLPLSVCVENLLSAVFNQSTTDINPTRPDYYLFVRGNTTLDVTGLGDDCCSLASLTINWRIDFSGGFPTSISGTGQPSTYNSNIQFPGNSPGSTDVNHTITYWVTDCNGNVSGTQVTIITVKPRPQIIKIS